MLQRVPAAIDPTQNPTILQCDASGKSFPFSNPPARTIYLTAGYEAIFGASACLNGEDDGVVQYASSFACNGSATASYDNTNVCNNSNKQEHRSDFEREEPGLGCHE